MKKYSFIFLCGLFSFICIGLAPKTTHAAITLIATSTLTCGSGQCNGTSTAINTTGGSLIVITVGGSTACFDPNADSFTDTAGNTFFHTTSTIDCAQSGNGMTTWYAWNIATSASDQIEASGSAIAADISVFSGIQTSSNPLDQWNQAVVSSAGTGSITVSTTTPSQNNELIYTGESRSDGNISQCGTYTVSSPMNILGNCTVYNFDGYPTVFNAYNVQSTAAGLSVTWNSNDGVTLHIAQVTTWKAAATTASTNASGYAWGNTIGWVNFGTSYGGLTVDTTTITGYAWSQNFGWINMAPASSGVLNDGHGNLSGDAWSQDAGYINFSGVTINQNGVFEGVASGTIAGSLQFSSSSGCADCNVSTTWTPPSGATLTVSSVDIDGNNPTNLTLTPDTTTNINVNATVTDNTCGEITGGTTTIMLYRSGVTSSTCMTAPNNLNCYIATAFTASSTCSGGTINTTTTFPVEYFAQATDASSSYPNQNWIGTVAFNDFSNPTSSADSTHATSSNIMSTLVALNTSSSSGGGPIAVIATTTAVCASPGDACSATSSAINTTGASLLVVIIDDFQHDPSTSVVSDSLGNTWHHLTVDNNDSINSLEMVMWYAYNHGGSPLSTGSSDTFNVSGSNIPSVDISAYSGTQTGSDPFDQQSERAISSFLTTIQPGSITPSANGELLVSGEGFQNSEGADTIDSGFTTMNNANASFDQSLDAYYVQPSAAAINPTWTGSADTTRLAIISSFEAAASGGSSSINYGILSPSSTTGSANQSTTISNAGNASTSLQLSGVALAKGSSLIATSSQHYATSSFTFGGSEQSLSGSATTVSGFLLTAPTSTSNVHSSIFWGLQVPNSTASGTYNGTNTFTAVFHA